MAKQKVPAKIKGVVYKPPKGKVKTTIQKHNQKPVP